MSTITGRGGHRTAFWMPRRRSATMKKAVRRPMVRSPKYQVGVCKTAARAEMLQTHTGGDNPGVCVRALHQLPERAAADVSNVLHARASALEKVLACQHRKCGQSAGMVEALGAGPRSRTQTQPRQTSRYLGQQTSSHAGASWVSCRVFERTGGGSPRERSTQRRNAERANS